MASDRLKYHISKYGTSGNQNPAQRPAGWFEVERSVPPRQARRLELVERAAEPGQTRLTETVRPTHKPTTLAPFA